MQRSVTPAEKLLVLTLTLEQSLLNGDFEGAETLLKARDEALEDRFDSQDPMEHQRVIDAARVEQRCIALLQSMRKAVVADLADGMTSRKAAGAYGAVTIDSGLDVGH